MIINYEKIYFFLKRKISVININQFKYKGKF